MRTAATETLRVMKLVSGGLEIEGKKLGAQTLFFATIRTERYGGNRSMDDVTPIRI